MLGLFRKILSRPTAPQTAPLAQNVPVARPATPPPPLPRPVARTPIRVTTALPKPLPQAAAQPAQSSFAEAAPGPNTHVQVALAAIAASLPEAISHKVPANPEQFVSVPIDTILPQLSEGQVVLSAAELRQCAPDYFTALAGHDDVLVTLPLGDIVKQLSPAHFARRQQTRVEVPHEVAPVFVSGGKAAPVVKPAAPQAAPVYRSQPTVTSTTALPAAATPAPAGKISMSPQALAAFNGKAPAPASAAAPRPATVVSTPAPATASNAAPRSTVVPLPKKNSSGAPKPTGELPVPLSAVCKDWVQEVRAQLADVDIEQSQILVPLELLEPAMKSGKVLFSWEEVASWIQPPLAIPPTPKVGEMSVDFPLKVLAPLFMGHHRGGAQKRVAVDEKIPDLFGGGNGNGSVESQIVSAPCAPTMPAAPVRNTAPVQPAIPTMPTTSRAPIAMPKLETESVRVAPASEEVPLENVVGNGTGRFNVKEIVANAARLPGVAGALLVMSDGLLVTSNTPPSVKAETIAAFLPQMFGRMNQYTKELALGPLQQLTLGVETGQWHVIKSNTIYFAVLGKHGVTLPLNLLAQVAAELSSQSK